LRGEVYTIDEQRIFVMGGASSHDRGEEVEDFYWWRHELPQPHEYENAINHLKACDYHVDYIITHCAPSYVQADLNAYYKFDALTDFLEKEVKNKTTFKKWYFGHYHTDRVIDEQMRAIYNDIIELGQ